ncbi:MAG: hypothetical protein QOJ56_5674 [Mycobacterium sp.]|jgi:hypothetical protein|nr:hypothetical protein [Mycobacterium sp.]
MNLGPISSTPPPLNAPLRFNIQTPKIVGPDPMSTLMNHGRGRNKEYPYKLELPGSAMARFDGPIAGPVDCGIGCRVCGRRGTG